MSRGVHFALTPEQGDALLGAKADKKLMALVEEIEEAWDRANLMETDKAWDAIHRCLTDGSLLYEGGEYPLNLCVCGGRQLHRGRGFTVSFVTAAQVKDLRPALDRITKRGMRSRYDMIDPAEYDGELGEEDFD